MTKEQIEAWANVWNEVALAQYNGEKNEDMRKDLATTLEVLVEESEREMNAEVDSGERQYGRMIGDTLVDAMVDNIGRSPIHWVRTGELIDEWDASDEG